VVVRFSLSGPAPYHRARAVTGLAGGEPMPRPPKITVLGSLNMDISVTVLILSAEIPVPILAGALGRARASGRHGRAGPSVSRHG
jgi:hypothetical protein